VSVSGDPLRTALELRSLPELRVASVPHADPYVRAVLPEGVRHLGPAGEPSPWLDPDHLERAADGLDVLHVHHGYRHLQPDRLERWTEVVRRLDVPLVVTVHQLRDPDQRTRARHDAHLAALLATAEVVLTLTPGAADEIAERFGRTAIVVAHPSIAAPDPTLGGERGLVAVLLDDVGPALRSPGAVVRAAHSGAVDGGGRLRVQLGPGLRLPALDRLAGAASLEVVRARLDDVPARAAFLQQAHVAVLPVGCGTHSRDLEICRDVGTRVVAPGCGRFREQWSDVVTYANDERAGLDTVSLTGAVSAALTRPAPRPADRSWRSEQRAAVQRVHAQVYAQVAADRAAGLTSSGRRR
jgi:hypothetical protein